MMEKIALNQIAVFPADPVGRQSLAQFQQNNRIVQISAGDFVRDNKREPAVWVIYIPGLDPYIEAAQQRVEGNNGNAEPNTKKRIKKTSL